MKALILIDIQNDFLPGGALPVKEGNEIIPIVNDLIKKNFDFIVASKDWHPKGHHSFASVHNQKPGAKILLNGSKQILWPDHCVQGSYGAEFAPSLNTKSIDKIFFKGIDIKIDSYSTFFDNAKERSTGLNEFLKEQNVDTVYMAGLATDYCVLFSTLDAINEGFKTYVIADACMGVELSPGDCYNAMLEMDKRGAKIVSSKEIKI